MNAIMAREVPELSVSSSSPAPAGCTWWYHLLHPSHSSSSAWSTAMPPPPPSSRWSDDGAAATSFTNETSSADLSGEPSVVVDQNHQQLWNQVLLNTENGGEQNSRAVDDGENFLRSLSSKRVINNNYAEKIEDGNWPPELCHPSSNSSSLKYVLEKHLGDHSNGTRAANYSIPDLVSNWSLAPPSSTSHLQPSSCDDDKYDYICHSATSKYDQAHLPAQLSPPPPSSCDPMINDYSASFCMRKDSEMSIPYLQHQVPWELQASTTTKPSSRVKGSDLLFCGNNRAGCHGSSPAPMKGNNGPLFKGLKKKRSEESSGMHLIKKKKYDSSVVSSNTKQLQVPKVKMAEKISVLQQLVSPFGKTDQASVLMETINCIRVLQEQVQLLSDPYLKSGVSKEQNPWGEVVEMRKEKDGASYDLRSRGLCLVPVSSIPQLHRESCRPDYWMPTFRSCFYR